MAEYVIGWLWLGVVAASHGWIAVRLRYVLLPGVSRPGGYLGGAALFVLSLLTLGQLLGAVGWLAWWPLLIGSVVTAAVVEIAARRLVDGNRPVESSDAPPARSGWWESRIEPVVAVACIAAVGWQWTTHLADAFDRGMVQADNLWYHGPFMARFMQTGGFGDLGTLGYSESRFYPMNSELLNAITSVPFDRDLLVPLTNHGFAVVWVLAAYVIGRRWGVGALAALTSMVVASLPLVASTQPGQMYNDIMAGALILAAVALLVDGATDVRGMAVAGGSLGTAIGMKLSVAAVVGPLAVFVLVVVVVARRYAAAVTWAAAVAVTGGFWFARNWVVHGSPTPYFDIRLGPIELPAIAEREEGETLFATLGRLDDIGGYYVESVRTSFGPLWPLLPIGSIVGCAVVLIRPHGWRLRSAAFAALAGVVAFPFLPLTGGLPFVNNLRYGVPTLMVGMVLLAVAVARWRWARLAITALSAIAVVGNLVSEHRGRVPAWPGHDEWGLLAAFAIVGGAWWWTQRLADPTGVARSAVRWGVAAAATAMAGALAVAAVWPLQRHYLENRYVDSGLDEDALFRPFHRVSDTSVQALGTIESYPLFGPDLSNDVTVWNDHIRLTATSVPGCGFWREEMDADRGYIAVSTSWVHHEVTAEQRAEWFERDPSVEVVVDSGPVTVYLHDGPLDPSGC